MNDAFERYSYDNIVKQIAPTKAEAPEVAEVTPLAITTQIIKKELSRVETLIRKLDEQLKATTFLQKSMLELTDEELAQLEKLNKLLRRLARATSIAALEKTLILVTAKLEEEATKQ